jgi:hypothetical protein
VKGKDGISIKNFAKKGASVINRDVVVFAFFLFLSFIFWYLNSLEKDIEADIKYPVRYVNIPRERVISEVPPASDLNLFLKGPGFSILKLKLSGNRTPVNIDISKVSYKRVPGSTSPNYFIVTSALTKSLAIQLRSGCEITSIKPDTLFFLLERSIAKPIDTSQENKDIRNRK